ncbi:MAG TPA: VOC family protein, partial [Candidatus Nitrosocosmicus sp.]
MSKIDHVHLRVSDLQKSTDFYQSILGFRVLKNESSLKTAVLSTTDSDNKITTPLLALTELQKKDGVSHYSKIKKEAGLYHFAILLPERKFLASFLRHIQNNLDSQYYEGMADHSVSESIYIHDPDFNGIEVYRDRLHSEWI